MPPVQRRKRGEKEEKNTRKKAWNQDLIWSAAANLKEDEEEKRKEKKSNQIWSDATVDRR